MSAPIAGYVPGFGSGTWHALRTTQAVPQGAPCVSHCNLVVPATALLWDSRAVPDRLRCPKCLEAEDSL